VLALHLIKVHSRRALLVVACPGLQMLCCDAHSQNAMDEFVRCNKPRKAERMRLLLRALFERWGPAVFQEVQDDNTELLERATHGETAKDSTVPVAPSNTASTHMKETAGAWRQGCDQPLERKQSCRHRRTVSAAESKFTAITVV
jgi:hypothetical protein